MLALLNIVFLQQCTYISGKRHLYYRAVVLKRCEWYWDSGREKVYHVSAAKEETQLQRFEKKGGISRVLYHYLPPLMVEKYKQVASEDIY